MMKVPPLSLVGMERLPLPLPFSPELLWRYNTLGPPHSNGPPTHPSSVSAAISRAAAAAAASIPSPLATQLPFAYDIKHTIPLNLANDPRLWNREDVMTFLQWCEREFDLPSFDSDRFQMNGKALCLLTKADLESRAPCSGDVIHNALQILSSSPPAESPLTPHTPSSLRMLPLSWKGACSIADLQQFAAAQGQGTTSVTLSPAPSLDGQAGSPQEAANPNASSSSSSSNGGINSDDSEYDGESPERSPANQSSLSPPPTRPPSSALPPQLKSTPTPKSFSPAGPPKLNTPADGSEYNNNGRLLWDFLQQLLNDPSQRYSSFITWKNVETGIFKIVDPPGLARLWGIQKNHLSMNYDKMSRALRYYYRVNILRKVQGERHCYQFLRNPGELKSIKNISMLRHQTAKQAEAPPPHYEVEYEGLSMLRPQQTSPVSLTTKAEGFSSEDYGEGLSMLRPTQTSPVSLTTKAEGDYHEGGVFRGKKEEDYESMMTQNSPMSLTRNDRGAELVGGTRMKVEEEEEEEEDYEDTPTDLSMDTERHLKEEENNQ